MLHIDEPNQNHQADYWHQHPVLELAFRPFFLLATLSSALSVAVWLLLLNGHMLIGHQGLSPYVWHAHEMLVGFAATVAVGFVLTAVQTWTGQASIKGKGLVGLIALWCLARLGFYINDANSVIFAIGMQGLWWLSVIAVYSKLVFVAKNRRNYIFIVLLGVMTAVDMAMLLFDFTGNSGLALHLSRSMVLLFTIMMALVGGRVIPFFTVRGANTQAINTPAWINRVIGPFAITTVAIFISSYFCDTAALSAIILIMLGALHIVRLSYWRSINTMNVPLLWSLHLSYGLMGLGLILLGSSQFLVAVTFSNALHLITIGAIGLMIFSMMSRVSLGHTGRTLKIKPVIVIAFILLTLATLVRTLMPILYNPLSAWNISGILWIVACLFFLVVYFPILISKRAS
ncbi:NnrS family protein [Agarivorans sp. MS3-6]